MLSFIIVFTYHLRYCRANLNDPKLTRPSPATLRLQAAQDSISMETEVRKILTEACNIDKKAVTGLQDLVERLYAGKNQLMLSNN